MRTGELEILDHGWIIVRGTVIEGYRVASGESPSSSYARGTIEMQLPFFAERGLDLKSFYPATLNVSITPLEFVMEKPSYIFRNVAWSSEHPPEHFSFSPCEVHYADQNVDGFVYYPHPETKERHRQSASTLEIITQRFPGIAYGDLIDVLVDPHEVNVRAPTGEEREQTRDQ